MDDAEHQISALQKRLLRAAQEACRREGIVLKKSAARGPYDNARALIMIARLLNGLVAERGKTCPARLRAAAAAASAVAQYQALSASGANAVDLARAAVDLGAAEQALAARGPRAKGAAASAARKAGVKARALAIAREQTGRRIVSSLAAKIARKLRAEGVTRSEAVVARWLRAWMKSGEV
jgi:hypothetical protein